MTEDRPGDLGDDPFDGLTIDEDWVARASVREPSASVRAAHAVQEQRHLAEEAQQARVLRRRQKARRRTRRGLFLAAFAVFAGAIAIADRGEEPGSSWNVAGDHTSGLLESGARPTPRAAASELPLGQPSNPDAAGGSYEFMATQPNRSTPVTYDPCRPIVISVNDRTAPPGGTNVVEHAVDTISAVTGLTITIDDAATKEEPENPRSSFQKDRYGDRWAPVLLAWSDPGEVPVLEGDTAGLGGSSYIQPPGQPRTYVTGIVVLDGPQLAQIMDLTGGPEQVEDVVLHELGHLVGLGHVDDTDELMYPEGQSEPIGLGRGDRTGLTRLGQGDCVPLL